MAECTPGPWLRIDTADYAEIHAQFRPLSQAIALVGKPADADLIAAAPDLLAALQAAVACRMVPVSTAKNGGATAYSEQVRVADMIRAAIASASGEVGHG